MFGKKLRVFRTTKKINKGEAEARCKEGEEGYTEAADKGMSETAEKGMTETAGEKNKSGDTPEPKEGRAIREKTPLMWSMMVFLIVCWILPLSIIVYIMLDVTTRKVNEQIERTIVTTADNAIKICERQMSAAITSSRSASYLPTIKESYKQYKKDGNKEDLYANVISFMEYNYRYDDNFLNTILLFTDEPDETYYVSRMGSENNPAYKANLRFMERVQPKVMELYQELDTGIKFINVDNHIYMMRNIMDSAFHPYAVIVMELDTEKIFGGLKGTWGYKSAELYIDKELLWGDHENELGQSREIFDGSTPPEEIMNADNRDVQLLVSGGEYYAYTVKKPGRHGVGFLIALDSQIIIDETENLKFVCTLFVLFLVPLTAIVFFFFHRKITKPVGRLVKSSKMIEKGRFGYQIEEKGNSRELVYLTESFNSMSNKLKYQFETIYSEELALKDARIMALQSQINPHFLNNTLEIINWEARINENYKVSQMIENLSIMLEATMDRRHRRFVTLAEEMSYVEAYLFIIAQRLGERLHVEKNVDETLFNVRLPRLIIQPIIENAVEHGINSQTHARIVINVFAREDKLIIEVRNTGRMSRQDEEKIKMLLSMDYEPGEFGSASLGIRNVNRRIKIIYGDSCGLYVKNDENYETVSTIVVKLDYDTNKRQ